MDKYEIQSGCQEQQEESGNWGHGSGISDMVIVLHKGMAGGMMRGGGGMVINDYCHIQGRQVMA